MEGKWEMTGPRFPYVQFALQLGQHSYKGEALIDTGFDGGFAVPPSLLQDVGPPDSYAVWQPVVGPPVVAPIYDATFQLDVLGSFPVTVTVLGDEILVGLELISHFAITLDHGQQVIVSP